MQPVMKCLRNWSASLIAKLVNDNNKMAAACSQGSHFSKLTQFNKSANTAIILFSQQQRTLQHKTIPGLDTLIEAAAQEATLTLMAFQMPLPLFR